MKRIAFLLALFAIGCLAQSAPAAYRLDFTLHENQNGKTVTERTYTLVLSNRERGGSSGRIRVGSKVPVKSASKDGNDQYTYEDTGFALDCTLQYDPDAASGELNMNVTVSVTSIVPPSQPPLPIFRTASTYASLAVPVGKRITIARLEDLNSDDNYEIDVTATPADASPAAPAAGHQ